MQIDPAAQQYLTRLQGNGLFEVSAADYSNPLKYAETISQNPDFYLANASTSEGQYLAGLNIGILLDPRYQAGEERGRNEEFNAIAGERGTSYNATLDDPVAAIVGLPGAIVNGIVNFVDSIKAQDQADQNKDAMHTLAILQGNIDAAGYIQGADSMRFASELSAGVAGMLLGGEIWLRYSDLVDWSTLWRGNSGDIELFDPVAVNNADYMGSFTATGSEIFHGSGMTRIGSDAASINVAENVARVDGLHDVIVHGAPYDEVGAMFYVDGMPTNANQIAEAVMTHPDWNGQSIRLLTCYGGCGPAQELSNVLRVPVLGASGSSGK